MTLTNAEIKLAKFQADRALLRDVVSNPMVVSVALYLILQQFEKKGIINQFKGTAVEAAVFAAPVLEAAFRSGAITQLVKSGADTLGKAGGSLIPLLLAVA